MIDQIEQIYRDHRQGLFTFALSITRNQEVAEDAVHDAIVRMCQKGTPPAGDAVAYVFAAVRNAAVDQLRRRGLVSIFQIAEPTSSSDAVDAGDRDQAIAAAIESLPEDQKEAVLLHLYSGLTFQQVSAMLQVPLQTIASRYRRALAKLQERLSAFRNE